MKDNKDFIKLFDLNIPVMEHFDYYIDQLSKTEKFKDIRTLISLFEEVDVNMDDVYDFKIKKSQEVINFIKTTNAYTDKCTEKTKV